MVPETFYKHLAEAIQVNRVRRPLYGALTHGKSKKISNILIFFEVLAIPLAFYFDFQARKFHKKGIPIIAEDFISMSRINAIGTPLEKRGRAEKKTFKALKRAARAYKKRVRQLTSFSDLLETTKNELEGLENLENELNVNFALYKHLIESISLITCHAIEYEERSHGKTTSLSKGMIGSHLVFLTQALWLDQLAQEFHEKGIGILVNDVPPIPQI